MYKINVQFFVLKMCESREVLKELITNIFMIVFKKK